MPKLTKALVAALEPPETGDEIVWDSLISGFGLRLWASGKRTYILKYRTRDEGRVRWLTIGRVGGPTLDEAREEAAKALGRVAAGEDPAAERQAARKAETMGQLVDLYEREGLFVQRGIRQGEAMKPTTAAYTIARLRHHVVPLLGPRKAKSITPGDVERFVRDVSAGRTARDETVTVDGRTRRIMVRGGEGAARKVVRDLSAVFSFAKRRGIVTVNPCEDARVRKTDNRRERFLGLSEIQRLGAALDELEASGLNPKAINITRLWSLTGARRNEIAGLKWSEVDLASGFLRLEASKTGRSVRPLGAAARAVLAALYERRDRDSPYVFPATAGEGFYTGTKRLWPRIVEKAGLPGVTPHVLRHSVGAIAASSGEALLIVGALLGHANARSTSIYAHVAEDPAQRAADRASSTIAAALSGREPAQVVGLDRVRARS